VLGLHDRLSSEETGDPAAGDGKSGAGEGGMRLGDYVLCLSMVLNASQIIAYAYQGHWAQSAYWFAALQLNLSLLWMK
jgi:hypothetical protein